MATDKVKEKPPCKHPDVYKEYYLGAQTGDQVCSSCNEVIYTDNEWRDHTSGKGPKLHDLP